MSRTNNDRLVPHSELASSLSHGLGLLMAIAGLVLLCWSAISGAGAREVTAVAVYGGSLVLLYACSTFYHGLPAGRARRVMRVMDHLSILLLIAGTYTPFTLITLRGAWGWSLFGTVWGLALGGIVLELSRWHYRRQAGVALYILMGWAVVIAAGPLWQALPAGGLWLLFLGGVAYTGGVWFYLAKRYPWAHPVWHLFVLAGSICHFFAVWFYVLPSARG